jgi:hypothetical protein
MLFQLSNRKHEADSMALSAFKTVENRVVFSKKTKLIIVTKQLSISFTDFENR